MHVLRTQLKLTNELLINSRVILSKHDQSVTCVYASAYGPTSMWGGGVKPSFARMANANYLSRGPAREKKIIMNYIYE